MNSWCLSLFLVASWSSSTPFYPLKVLRAREHAPTPCSSTVFSLDSHLSPLRSFGVHHGGKNEPLASRMESLGLFMTLGYDFLDIGLIDLFSLITKYKRSKHSKMSFRNILCCFGKVFMKKNSLNIYSIDEFLIL